MATDRRRIMLTPDADTLAVLGYDIADPETGSAALAGLLGRLAGVVAHAARELDAVLSRAEWNAIADVMNGCADLYDYGGLYTPPLLMVAANLQDSPGIGEKWGIDVPDLCRRLAALTPAHGEAILAAVRHFWGHHRGIDHTTAEWWKVGARRVREGR